jgi:glycosyltransferase involved in cell wall biosynthesis
MHLALLRVIGHLDPGTRRAHAPGAPLRVLAHTPGYPPNEHGGAEITLRAVVRELRARGHDVRVLADHEARLRQHDGIDVFPNDSWRRRRDLYRWSDVVLAHLASRHRAIRLAARHARPFVYYVQIGGTPRNAAFGRPALTVFNSCVVREQFPWVEDAIVLHPPIADADYHTTPGDGITLVNLNAMKGAGTFFALANQLPARRFVGVRGWGPQAVPEPVPPNVTILDPVDDMRTVYGQTRILLVPSSYEALGRVALEAAVSGIPTIAHPAAGVQEAMGEAAMYVDRDDIDGWTRAIETLDDEREYARRSALARARFAEASTPEEFDAFERAIRALVTP